MGKAGTHLAVDIQRGVELCILFQIAQRHTMGCLLYTSELFMEVFAGLAVVDVHRDLHPAVRRVIVLSLIHISKIP